MFEIPIPYGPSAAILSRDPWHRRVRNKIAADDRYEKSPVEAFSHMHFLIIMRTIISISYSGCKLLLIKLLLFKLFYSVVITCWWVKENKGKQNTFKIRIHVPRYTESADTSCSGLRMEESGLVVIYTVRYAVRYHIQCGENANKNGV